MSGKKLKKYHDSVLQNVQSRNRAVRNNHLSSRRGLIQQLRLATVLLRFKIIIQAIVNIISMVELQGPISTGGGGGSDYLLSLTAPDFGFVLRNVTHMCLSLVDLFD